MRVQQDARKVLQRIGEWDETDLASTAGRLLMEMPTGMWNEKVGLHKK